MTHESIHALIDSYMKATNLLDIRVWLNVLQVDVVNVIGIVRYTG